MNPPTAIAAKNGTILQQVLPPEPDERRTERAPVETVPVPFEEADDSVVDPFDSRLERVRSVDCDGPNLGGHEFVGE
jgi:hypothetical protein